MKRLFENLWGHKMSVLSALLVAVAVLLGASSGFAMAVVDPVQEAASPNPSTDINPYDAGSNPGGRPAGEAAIPDEQGNNTQMPNNPSSATNLRDAGLLAEDYDEKTVEFRKFRFPEETIIARVCKPVKAKDYVHKHWVTGSTDLDAVYGGAANATINGDVTLIVTSGKIGQVFGGNDTSGSINGSITVYVREDDACEDLEIGELFGGGNQAPYSKWGYTKNDGGVWVENEHTDANLKVTGIDEDNGKT